MSEAQMNVKVDRRIERTKRLLRDALLELIVEKGYDSITISDIADRADVARTTFYMHFADKDELLFKSIREIYQALFDQVVHDASILLDPDCIEAGDFEHVQEYAAFYKVMLSHQGSMAFFVYVMEYLAQEFCEKLLKEVVTLTGHIPTVPLQLQAYIMSGQLIATVKWWLDNDLKHTPEQMATMLKNIMSHGLSWSMELDPAQAAELRRKAPTGLD
ncbi:MAG: TetR/AcrR family transcriptional regulator [Anaerolineaceae bacterium]|nr:TetR/AcrR family transcriptional regulator [Anaerolineaceae bacterium]